MGPARAFPGLRDRLLALLFLAAMLPVLCGCGSSSDAGTARADRRKAAGEIAIAYGLDTDATPQRSGGDMLLKISAAERLVELSGTRIVPGLASSWEIQDNGQTIVFRLRDDVRFSDGTPLIADAVKFTFDRLLAFDSSSWTETDRIERIEIIDPYTIAFHYRKGMAGYIALTAFAEYGCSILSPNSVDPPGTPDAPITRFTGTGPWMVESYTENEETVFVPNPHYHGSRPSLNRIIVKTVPGAEARVLALQSGGVDAVLDYYHGGSAYTPRNLLEPLRAQGFSVLKREMPMTTYLVFNYRKAPWNRLGVRKAFNHAVNREDVAALFDHWITTAEKALFSDTAPYIRDTDTAPIPYDPDRARQLLAEEDFPLEVPVRLIARGENPDEVKLCEILKAQLGQAGVNVTLSVLEPGVYTDRTTNGDFDLRLYYIGGPERRKFTRMDGRFNPEAPEFGAFGFFSDPAITPVLKKAVTAFDEMERAANFHAFYRLANDLAPGVPLYFDAVFVVCRPDLTGIRFASSEPRFDRAGWRGGPGAGPGNPGTNDSVTAGSDAKDTGTGENG